MKKLLIWLLVIGICLGFFSSVGAAPLEEKTSKNWVDRLREAVGFSRKESALKEKTAGGIIDWAKGTVVVTGVSSTGKGLEIEKAALTDAYKKLITAVDGIRISSDSLVKDLTQNPEIRERLKTAITKKMSVGEVKRQPDGSVVVKVQLPIYGKGGVAEIIYPTVFSKTAPAPKKKEGR